MRSDSDFDGPWWLQARLWTVPMHLHANGMLEVARFLDLVAEGQGFWVETSNIIRSL